APLTDQIFDVAQILAFASRYFTWEENDILLTGTPGTPPPLIPGDVVAVACTGIPELRCPVVVATALNDRSYFEGP
ncbi:MAG: fumarylacetoacetate hydrolase family protein, partial [Cyanobacteria bacterium REEB65]|nr:fumarylacetoacetate hydrolase family protein [Cyanobacteria bacterium REEB65]